MKIKKNIFYVIFLIFLIFFILKTLLRIEYFGCAKQNNINYHFAKTSSDNITNCTYCGNSSYLNFCY